MRTIARQIEERSEKRGMQAKAKAIAKNMLQEGLDISLIQKVTGLSLEAIEKLKQE